MSAGSRGGDRSTFGRLSTMKRATLPSSASTMDETSLNDDLVQVFVLVDTEADINISGQSDTANAASEVSAGTNSIRIPANSGISIPLAGVTSKSIYVRSTGSAGVYSLIETEEA